MIRIDVSLDGPGPWGDANVTATQSPTLSPDSDVPVAPMKQPPVAACRAMHGRGLRLLIVPTHSPLLPQPERMTTATSPAPATRRRPNTGEVWRMRVR
jgi:hypothetical protein